MAPVPPFTVRMSATLRMMSFGDDQPDSWPVRCTPITCDDCESSKHNGYHTNLRAFQLPRNVRHHIDSVSAAHANAQAAEATCEFPSIKNSSGRIKSTAIGCVAIGADEKQAGESVILENNLMNNTRARLPKADAILGAGRRQEVVHFFIQFLQKKLFRKRS